MVALAAASTVGNLPSAKVVLREAESMATTGRALLSDLSLRLVRSLFARIQRDGEGDGGGHEANHQSPAVAHFGNDHVSSLALKGVGSVSGAVLGSVFAPPFTLE